MYNTFSLHRIKEAASLPFEAGDYSRFKFGDGAQAQAFGSALGNAFVAQHESDLLRELEIVYVPSPYDAIPTASYAMAEAFKDVVNLFLYHNGRKSLLSSKIHRYKTYTEDYGALSLEERLTLISSDAYHLDKDFLQGRMVLFLDDIRITGSHEVIIQKQLERVQISGNFFFLYFALLDNPAIAPQFENYLNYHEVDGLSKLAALFQKPDFKLNTRVIKYILKSDVAGVLWLQTQVPAQQLEALIAYAIGNNYHLMAEYQTNLHTLIQTSNYGH